ncbi:hypothetical protein [Mycolicibacterium sp. XJ1819]
MAETVTITPAGGRDSDGDPVADGAPFDVRAWEVAPGNTMERYGIGGDLDVVDFTVFLPLRIRDTDAGGYVSTVSKLTEEFWITVRERQCRGRAQEWESGGRGGVVVLAHSATGKAA